jgi:hypothetical protein
VKCIRSSTLSAHKATANHPCSEFPYSTQVSLGRKIRHNLSCVWLADDTVRAPFLIYFIFSVGVIVWAPVWRRIAPHMPSAADQPAGLNQCWRLYRYGPNDVLKMHMVGSWPGSGAREGAACERSGEVIGDGFGDRWSQVTLLLYLDVTSTMGAPRGGKVPLGEFCFEPYDCPLKGRFALSLPLLFIPERL